MMNPSVSVVLCTYNGVKYIEEQIFSILRQTYPILELIIQDDCSTDGTYELLRRLERDNEKIRVFRNDQQLGINRNFMSVLQRAQGDYIAISDQDDIWELDKIENQINCIGDKLFSSGFSCPFSERKEVTIYFDDRIPNYCLERVVYVSSLAGHTMLFKRSFLDKLPPLEKWSSFLMYDQFLQIIAAAYDSISFCDKILVRQRRHLGAATYGKPESYEWTLSNIMNTVRRTYREYHQLRPFIRNYFMQIADLLKSLPEEAVAKENTIRMALLQSGQVPFSFLRLICFCVRWKKRILYAKQKNGLIAFMRAVYFPISCSDYFRYMIK